MIIDNTYFEKDPIYISGIANRKDDKPTALAQALIDSANSYIAIYEPRFLRNLLGEALAETAEENPQIVALLRNEAVKTSPIANYVYFYWLRTHTTVGTPAGEKVQRGEYSDEASPRIRAIEVWNDMVRQCCVLRPKLVELGAVPDYCSAIFEPQTYSDYDRQIDRHRSGHHHRQGGIVQPRKP